MKCFICNILGTILGIMIFIGIPLLGLFSLGYWASALQANVYNEVCNPIHKITAWQMFVLEPSTAGCNIALHIGGVK